MILLFFFKDINNYHNKIKINYADKLKGLYLKVANSLYKN